jgi:hypothetical protein
MKNFNLILLPLLLFSCSSSESSNKNPSDSTHTTSSEGSKLSDAIPAAATGMKTTNTATIKFDKKASDAKSISRWTWCCNSSGHPGRPDVDNCTTEWTYNTYPECNAWTIVHKKENPSHDCGCRPN